MAIQSQSHTFYVKLGQTMACSIGSHYQVSPASLIGIIGLTMLVVIPVYDCLFVPVAQKFTSHHARIIVLQRIRVDLFLSTLNMTVSTIVEAKRIKITKEHNLIEKPSLTIPISIWWLLPQYFILGMADSFTVIGFQALFYDQMPEAMRSLGAGAYASIVGVGSFVSNAIIVIVEAVSSRSSDKWLDNNINKAHLNYFYWVLAVLTGLALVVFVLLARVFVHKNVNSVEIARV